MARLMTDSADAQAGEWAFMEDGRRWGPFASRAAAGEWEGLFRASFAQLATARDLWEGRVPAGEPEYTVSDFAVEFGMHPFGEVYDWYRGHDNGRPVADTPGGARAFHPDEAVLTGTAVRLPPARLLPSPEIRPAAIDLASSPSLAVASGWRGDIVVAEQDGMLAVAWRRDRRVTRSLPVLSWHGIAECAGKAAKEAARFWKPPSPQARTRPVDYQRKKAYRWEASLGAESERLADIEACRRYAGEVCQALGVPPPMVSAGRSSLENHSYHSVLKGIVLQRDMMTTGTILHELAHYLVRLPAWHGAGKEGWRQPGHGPAFAGTLAGLLGAFAGVDIDDALAKAGEAGLDVDADAAASVLAAAGRMASPAPR